MLHNLRSSLVLLLGISFLPAKAIAAQPQLVVSARQYQEVGPSNIHLYLYTLKGTLVRQLTNTPGLDDVSPMFDRAGETVLFFRLASTPDLKAKEGCYVLDLRTNTLKKLSSEKTKFEERRREPTLSAVNLGGNDAPLANLDKEFQADVAEGENSASCQSPDGNYKLIRKKGPYHRYEYLLRIKGSSNVFSLLSLPGYSMDDFVDEPNPFQSDNPFLGVNGSPFVQTPGFSALFLRRSKRPSTVWMLDLKAKRWTEISDWSGEIYIVPRQTGVTLLQGSLESIGKSPLGLVCCYLEFLGATNIPPHYSAAPNGINYYPSNGTASTNQQTAISEIHPIRFGPPTSCFHGAALFYGSGQTSILPDPQMGS
jgi:hypothetical protein